MNSELIGPAAAIAAVLVQRLEPGQRVDAPDITASFLLAYRGLEAAVRELAAEAPPQRMTSGRTTGT